MEWDALTLRRFRDGETAALGQVYRAHAEPLTRALKGMAWKGQGFAHLRSALEVENAVLEVFARAFEPRTRLAYDGLRPYGNFLLGIARNVLLEQARQREVAVGLEPLEESGQGAAEAGEGLADVLEDQEVEALLVGFKEGLSPEERRLFELRFGEGMAQEGAAEELGLTRIQVRRRELGLKTRLLEFLQARGYLEGWEMRGWGFFKRRGQA